jgi:hypothetical protein
VWGWDTIILCAAVERERETEVSAPAGPGRRGQVALLSTEEDMGMIQ